MHTTNGDELAWRLVGLVDAVSRGGGTSVHAFLDETQITPGQLRALMSVADQAEPFCVGALARSLSLSLPTASRIADVLTRHEWVERTVCADDRRSRHLVITPRGAELVARFSEARAADVRVFVGRLSADRRRRLGAALAALEPELAIAR